MLLLSDGSVVTENNGSTTWYRLVPDIHGSYLNGTWTTIAPMNDSRLYGAFDVLRDGRLFICGGEYGNSHTSEVYDPLKNIWTRTALEGRSFVDSLSALLPDGKVLMGASYTATSSGTPIYDPVTDTWSAGAVAHYDTGEGVWLKLADGSILQAVNGASERYIPSTNQWVVDAAVPATLFSGGETGSAYLLPDGRAIFLGYSHTDIYTPDPGGGTGSWVAGPDIPDGQNCGDNPAVMMNNGVILFTTSSGYTSGYTSTYEYDYTTNTFTNVGNPPSVAVGFVGKFLNLPDGTVMYGETGSRPSIYTPGSAPLAAGKPTISSVVHNGDGTYTLTGTLLTGITEGAAYGDDAQSATNYPLVRLSSGTNVYYARTFNWNTTNVMTGSTPETTQFTLPLGLPAGTYSVVVTTNGNPSSAVSLTIPSGTDAAPTVATAAAASPTTVTGLTTNLSVLGADTDGGGESNLTYTWTSTAPSNSIATPSFSVNGTNSAKNTTATFLHAGTYSFKVYITDSAGLFTTSTVSVTVNQTLTSVSATPALTNLTSGQTKQLTATGYDQFGVSMTAQPTFTWSLASGGGSVNSTGLYTSPATGTVATVTATTGALSDTAGIYVVTAPWVSVDIGGPSVAGVGTDSAGTYTISGGGKDVWGTSDQLHYVYRTMDGDGTIIARIATQDNTAAWAKSGVMIRDSLDPADQYAFMFITPGNGSSFQYRSAPSGSAATQSTTSGITTPYWVKLVRSGNTFTAYRSSTGSSWTLQGSVSIAMGSSTYIGLGVCSVNDTTLNTSTFDNVSVTTAANDTLAATPGVGATVNVIANDKAGSGTLSVTAVTQGAKGTVVNNGDGTVTYTAASTSVGQDVFTYTVTDTAGNVASASVMVKINGIQVWYPFEEAAGTTTTDYISGLTGTLSGTTLPTWSTGIQGTSGLVFNGTTGFVNVPAMNLNSNTVTLTGWVKRNGTQSSFSGLIFTRASSTASGLHFGTANELRYTWNNLSSTYNWSSGLVPPDATWTFVALVITPTNATIYMKPVGGSLTSATNAVANTASSFNGVTCIGQDSTGGRFFKGSMDEVRIYNTSLNSTQITALANPTLTVATAAAATPNPATGTTTGLSVLGSSTAGAESTLTYNWIATSIPSGAPIPTFSANGTNAAKNTTVTFGAIGTYILSATITDTAGATLTSDVTVTVNPTLTSVAVTPTSVGSHNTVQLVANGLDQFGQALASQPTFTWSSTGVGSVSGTGLYTAPYASGTATATATSASISGNGTVTVTDAAPTVATAAAASPSTVTGSTTNLSILGADSDGGGESNLTYTWAATTLPTGATAPAFSANGTNAAKNTTATFNTAGAYVFTVTMTDAGGATLSKTVSVTVSQTLAGISVSPPSAGVALSATQQLTAIGADQFGKVMAAPTTTWTLVSGLGSVSTGGLYTAPASGSGSASITATAGGFTGTATITLTTPGNGTWTNLAGGSWPNTSNWSGGTLAGGVGNTANFGTLNITADATVTLDGSRTIGNLSFGDTTASNNWILNAGSSGTLTLDVTTGNPLVTVNNQTTTIGAIIAGTKGLTKAGSGTLLLSAANTYTGATTINAGTLVIGNNTQLNAGANSLVVATTGTLQLNAGASGSYPTCGITVNGAGASATTGLYLNAGVSHNAQAKITLATAPTTIRTSGTGTAQIYGFDVNGTMIQTNTAASGSVIASTINIGGGTYGVNFSTTAGSATSTGDLEIDGNLLNVGVSGFGLNFNGSGSVLLTGASPSFTNNSYNKLTVNTGTLILGGANTFAGGSYGGSVVLGSSGKLKYDRTAAAQTFSGVISGNGSLIKSNTGTLTLSGTNTYTGTTTVSGGTLSVTGALSTGAVTVQSGGTLAGSGTIGGATTVQSGGAIAPVGTLTVNSTLGLSGTAALDIGRTGATLSGDRISGISTVTYGGALLVTNTGSDALLDGDTFQLFSATTYTGTFSSITLPTLTPGLVWETGGLAATGSIRVGAVPVTVADSATISEDGVATVAVLANDSDADGDAMVIQSVTQGAHGTVSISGTNVIYTPAPNWNGTDSFTYTVTDNVDGTSTAMVTVTVTPVNDAPVFTANPITGSNGTQGVVYSGSIASYATDVDAGDTQTFSKVSGPAWLSVAANGALSGTPANGDVGSNSFTVKVTDAAGANATTTLNITVINVNDAPTFTANPITGANGTQDAAYSGSIASYASDIDVGDTLTFSKVSGPSWLSVSSTGALSGTPLNANVGANSFTVKVTDAAGANATTTLNINVINVNDAPTFTANPITGANGTQDVAYSGSIAGYASDIDVGDTLTFSKVSGPSWLSVSSTGALSGTPLNANVGANSFTVKVTDAAGANATTTLNITVINVNDAPTFSANPITGADGTQDSAYSGSIAGYGSDIDVGDTITYSKVSGPSWLSVASNGTLSGTPLNANVGANSFTVKVTDVAGASATTTLNINVINVNDAPTFTVNPISGADGTQDAAYSGSIASYANDIDVGDTLTFTKVSGPSWLSVSSTGVLSGTPLNANVGTNSFTVKVTDVAGANATTTLNINVINVNDAPTFTANPITGAGGTQDAAYSGSIASYGSDIDAGDTLAYSKVSGPSWLSVAANGALSGTPLNANVGANSFVVKVTDAAGANATSTLNISVANVNDAPTFTANPITGPGGTQDAAYSGSIASYGNDIDVGDTITFSKVSGPSWLSVASDGTLTGTPLNANVGANSFTVKVTDAAGLNATATLNITVANVNDAPVFTANPITGTGGTQDAAYTGSIASYASDIDVGDTLTFTKVSGPSWLSVSSTGALSGTPLNANVGANNFTVKVTDAAGANATTTLNITVANVNDAPTFSTNPITGAGATEAVAYSGSIASYASDIDVGDTLTFSKVAGPTWLTVAADGTLGGTPGNSDGGLNVFTVRATDGSGATADATLNVTVTLVNNNGTFTSLAGGSWPTTGNWSGGVFANGIGKTADFSTLNLTADATVTLDGARTIGNLTFGDTTASHNWILNTGTAGPLTLDVSTGAPLVTVNNQTATIGAIVTGSKGLTKAGSGILVLNGANTYTGVTTVNAGTLVIGNNTELNSTATGGGIVVATTGTLQLNAGASGGSYPKCSITVNGAGASATTGLYVNTGVNHSCQAKITLTTAATTVRAAGAGTGTLSGFDINGTMLQTDASASGSIVSSGINLGGSGYGFALSTTAGTNTATGDLEIDGNLLNAGVDGFGVYFNGTGSVLVTSPSAAFTNNVRNKLTINSTGTLIFGGANAFVGGTYGGSVVFGSSGKLKWDRTASAQTFSGVMSGAGSLIKSNTGTLTLSGTNTYTGTTTISGGTLNVTGALSTGAVTVQSGGTLAGSGTIGGAVTVQSGGAIAPAGTLTTSSTVSLAGTTSMHVGKSGTTLSNDKLSGITTVTYGGTLTITNNGPTALASGDSFTLFSATTRSGSFSSISLPTLTAGLTWDTSRLTIDGTLAVTALPAGWVSADIGSPGGVGGSGYNSATGVYTISGSGADIWGTVDAFQFASTTLTGDGEIRARVTSQTNTAGWAKAGVMVRDGTSAGAAHTMMMVTPSNGFNNQYRATAGGSSSSGGTLALNTAPNNWVRISRCGSLFSTYASANGTAWTLISQETITMASTVNIGLAVDSAVAGTLSTATFDNVSVTPYPSPWVTADIGTTGVAGRSEYFGSVHTLNGAGVIGGTADGFRYTYQALTADGDITVRIPSFANTGTSSRIGVMIRDTLGTGASEVFLGTDGSGAFTWSRRTATGGTTTTSNSGTATAPNVWVRLVRSGSNITAYSSVTGTTWTTVGTVSVTMATNCYIGLAVGSGNTTGLNASTFDNITVTP